LGGNAAPSCSSCRQQITLRLVQWL
ncbi:unnamed protein product, partial [Allacma fusca]